MPEISFLPHWQMAINSWFIHTMQCKQIWLACRVKNTTSFKMIKQTVIDVQHPISMHWLCTLRPAIMLPLPGPRLGCCSMKRDTPTFSPPLSDLTLEGSPYLLTASINKLSTVWARLFVLHVRYTGMRVYPSTPPWTTSLHLNNRICYICISNWHITFWRWCHHKINYWRLQ